jgi:NAD(P)-dependent dehydrogenase (short-subunit alcohol dehydrogenase family)
MALTLVQYRDVSKEEDVVAAVAKTVERFGSIDHAVNNAGIAGPMAECANIDLAGWERTFAVNSTVSDSPCPLSEATTIRYLSYRLTDPTLQGVFLCQKAELNQMLKQEYGESHLCRTGGLLMVGRSPSDIKRNRGTIVNVASMLGIVALPPTITSSAYVASKHAIVGLTKSSGALYADKATKDIRINAICPGYVSTPLLEGGIKSGEMAKEFARIPAGRLATMEEIADSIVYLSSPMSSYMYGHALVVDGYVCMHDIQGKYIPDLWLTVLQSIHGILMDARIIDIYIHMQEGTCAVRSNLVYLNIDTFMNTLHSYPQSVLSTPSSSS